MRILVLGGYGLVGAAVVRHLSASGHEVTGLGRSVAEARRRHHDIAWIERDIAALCAPADWHPLLVDFDAAVNCSGALQDGPRDDLRAVQSVAMQAFFEGCRQAGVRRVVQISAVSASAEAPTAFMRTKAEADAALRESDLGWTILRPGLVLAPVAYGATALLRALASLPVQTSSLGHLPPIQTVFVDDVAEAVRLAVEERIPSRSSYDLVEENAHSLPEIVAALRAWLGYPPARIGVPVPYGLLALGFRLGDGLGHLGWRSPLRTTALRQLESGISGDSVAWAAASCRRPSGLGGSLSRMPCGVQDRWFGRLWLLKALVVAALALFWLGSGVIAVLRFEEAMSVATVRGMTPALAAALVAGGILLDIGLGGAILIRRAMPWAALGMVATTCAYLAAGTISAPDLWLDPLGPYLKTIPGAVLALVAYALADER